MDSRHWTIVAAWADSVAPESRADEGVLHAAAYDEDLDGSDAHGSDGDEIVPASSAALVVAVVVSYC